MRVYWPNFAKRDGLIHVVAQDATSKTILMSAFVDEAGFRETLQTGEAVYWSTSRKERWKKGESSGNTQKVRGIFIDCDGDAVIYLVEQTGGACHTEAWSCFYRCVTAPDEEFIYDAPKAGEKDALSIIELP